MRRDHVGKTDTGRQRETCEHRRKSVWSSYHRSPAGVEHAGLAQADEEHDDQRQRSPAGGAGWPS